MSSTQPKLHAIGMLEIGGETTFGTDAGAGVMDYVRTMVLDRSSLEAVTIRQDHQRQDDSETTRIIGPRTGSLTTTHYLHGFQSSVRSTAASGLTESSTGGATAWDHLVQILGSAIGNCAANVHYISQDPASSTVAQLQGADLSGYVDGQAVAFNTTSGYQVGWIQSNNAVPTPDEADLLQHVIAAPSVNPTPIFGGYTCFLKTGDPYHSSTTSWTLKYTGHDADDVLEMYGCQPTNVQISIPIGQLPTITITWGIAHWSEEGSGGPATVKTWAFPEPEAAMDGVAMWGTGGANYLLQNLEIDFGLERQPIPDITAESGIGGWYTVKRTPTVTFTAYRDVSEGPTLWEAQTGRVFTATIGSQPGKLFSVCIPNSRISEFPAPNESDSAVTNTITLQCDSYTGDTDAASDSVPSDTDFRIAFL